MLCDGYQYFEIKQIYPSLTDSFLTNINTGLNFIREDLHYPLTRFHSKFSLSTQQSIIDEIKKGTAYSIIKGRYGISISYIASINLGKRWHRDNEIYPLCDKKQTRNKWSNESKKLLIYSSISIEAIAARHNKTPSDINQLNFGVTRRDRRLVYPLRENCIENQRIWPTLFK